MSGIIGGAGSQSGVIGETELDYEEGSWTPTNNGGTVGVTVSYARYIKIGKVVHLTMFISLDGTGDGGAMELGGLPFPNTNVTNAHYAWSMHHNGTSIGDGDHVIGRFRQGESMCKFYIAGSNDARTEAQVDDGAMLGAGTYFID